MSIIDFCNKHGIYWFPLNLKISEKQKIPQPIYEDCYKTIKKNKDGDEYESFTPSYTDFYRENIDEAKYKERQKLLDKYEYIAVDTHKIQQLDCDSEETKEHFMNHKINDNAAYISGHPYFLSVKKRLPHIFLRFSQSYKDPSKLLEKKNHRITPDDENKLDYDLLCGQWSYVNKNTIVYNAECFSLLVKPATERILFPEALKKLQKEQPKKQKEEKEVKEVKEEKEQPKEEDLDIEIEVKKVLKKISTEKKTKIKEIKDDKEKEIKRRNHKKIVENIEKLINKDDLNEFEKELVNYLDCLSDNRFTNYDDWMKLTTIIKANYGDNVYNVYDIHCSKYKNYDKNGNLIFWKNLKSDKISMGTLLYWCKEDNYKKYSEIILKKYDGLNISDKFCCEILSMITDNIIWKKDTLYIYDGQIWKSGLEAINKFKDIIDNELYDYINLHILTCFIQSKEIQTLIKQLRRIQTQRGKDDIIKTSKQPHFGFNKDDDENIKFNKDWFLFPMKTKVYNLNTSEFEEYKKDMYITSKLNYDYIKPEKKVEQEFNLLLTKIFPNEQIKQKFLMICSTGLENRLKQKIHIFTGCGGNGKSLLCKYLSLVLGQFYYLGDTQIITYGGKRDDTKIANMGNKRVIMFPEPDKLKKIDTGDLKKYTGEDNINARVIYEKNTDNANTGTYIICCNTLPLLSEVPDPAVKRRFDITPFVSMFTSDKTLINNNNNIYEADSSLEQKGEYFKQSFLKCIMDTYNDYKKNNYQYNVIDECETMTKKYYEKSNILVEFFNDNFKFSESEDDIISIKEIYDIFRYSNIYSILSKEEKRLYNRGAIIEFIESNPQYKSRYGVNNKNNAILKKIISLKDIEED